MATFLQSEASSRVDEAVEGKKVKKKVYPTAGGGCAEIIAHAWSARSEGRTSRARTATATSWT